MEHTCHLKATVRVEPLKLLSCYLHQSFQFFFLYLNLRLDVPSNQNPQGHFILAIQLLIVRGVIIATFPELLRLAGRSFLTILQILIVASSKIEFCLISSTGFVQFDCEFPKSNQFSCSEDTFSRIYVI